MSIFKEINFSVENGINKLFNGGEIVCNDEGVVTDVLYRKLGEITKSRANKLFELNFHDFKLGVKVTDKDLLYSTLMQFIADRPNFHTDCIQQFTIGVKGTDITLIWDCVDGPVDIDIRIDNQFIGSVSYI